MLKGKTSTGFSYQISEERLNNYELLEAIGQLEDNPLVLAKVIQLLLGPDLAKKLKDHVRTASGIVPADRITDEVKEIFGSQKKLKKS